MIGARVRSRKWFVAAADRFGGVALASVVNGVPGSGKKHVAAG
jgi:hypothetical protein